MFVFYYLLFGVNVCVCVSICVTFVVCMYVCRNFSFFHHYGPSTSFASQSSLGIILENSTVEHPHHVQHHQRSHSLKNRDRSEYEQLDGDYDEDNMNSSGGGGIGGGRSSSCSSGRNADDSSNKCGKSGSRGWRNVRAVMAYYLTLRKIKRHGASLFFYLCISLSNSILYIILIYLRIFTIHYTHNIP